MIAGENQECMELLEREAVVEVANRLFIGTDDRDWDAVLSCFADEVLFDMASVTGGAPERMPAQRIVEGWDEPRRSRAGGRGGPSEVHGWQYWTCRAADGRTWPSRH